MAIKRSHINASSHNREKSLPLLGKSLKVCSNVIFLPIHGLISQPILKFIRKNVLFSPYRVGSKVYNFKCQCDAEYIGRTGQKLKVRINQYVPAEIRREQYENLHTLLNTSICPVTHTAPCLSPEFSSELFSLVSRAHSDYHLKTAQNPIY